MTRPIIISLCIAALIGVLFLVSCDDESWTKYPIHRPDIVACADWAAAQQAAVTYSREISGIEVNRIGSTFSMSRTFDTGDIYVVEAVPYDEAGGYPMVFWQDDTHRSRILHWALAKNAKGEYVTAGDSPRNQLDDETLGIAKPVTRARYFGVVKRAFTYRR